MNLFKIIIILFCFSPFFSLFAQYNAVKIGEQTWMTENLNVEAFRNGDKIKQAKSARKWKRLAKRHKPTWCYYENIEGNGRVYGKLYNWYAVNDVRGLSPCGWHVPTDMEFNQLTEYLGGEDIAGIKMKSAKGWKEHVNNLSDGTNKSGFIGLPGGYRFSNGLFFYKGNFGYWWTSTIESKDKAISRDLSFDKSSLGKDSNEMINGLSVRCVKD